ncbi:MAG TPA: phosphotransferase [Euzebya sp.]|nr:phosphotransferase [Euzebya sp.]
MRAAPGLLAQAVRCGLADPADVLGGRAWLEATPRSNVVHRLVGGGQPVAYSKQRGAASRLDGDDPVAHERRVLPALAALRCLPSRLEMSDETCLWTDAVPGVPLLEAPGDRRALRARARAFGAAVGALHAHPVTSGAPAAPRPWALDPDDLPPSMRGGCDHPALDAVHDALQDPVIREVLGRQASCWDEVSWIHGDLGPANVLVGDGPGCHHRADQHLPDDCEPVDLAGGRHSPTVWLVDLESAGMGHPGWDLAGALDTLSIMASQWGVAPGELFAAFGSAYRGAGGSAHPDAGWRCVQALTRAWRVAAGVAHAAADVDGMGGGAADHDNQVIQLVALARASANRELAGTAGRRP